MQAEEQAELHYHTVLAAELRGFVALAEPLPPAQVAAVLDAYYRGIVQAAEANGATLIRFRGPVVLAAWDAALGLGGGAIAAGRTARLLVSTPAFAPDIRFGIGIATGPLFIGPVGPNSEWTDMVGDTVNTAILLAGAAGAGQVLITEDTVKALGTQAQVEETEPLLMQGKRRRVRIYTLLQVQT